MQILLQKSVKKLVTLWILLTTLCKIKKYNPKSLQKLKNYCIIHLFYFILYSFTHAYTYTYFVYTSIILLNRIFILLLYLMRLNQRFCPYMRTTYVHPHNPLPNTYLRTPYPITPLCFPPPVHPRHTYPNTGGTDAYDNFPVKNRHFP